jgi:5-methylcytosine-specific restriction protein A
MIKKIKEVFIDNKYSWSKNRSAKWPAVRDAFIEKRKECFVCGSKKNLEVHHIVPFSDNPDLELVEDNLIILCESKKYGVNCHLFFGHVGNYKFSNENILKDASEWKDRFEKRSKQIRNENKIKKDGRQDEHK